MNSKITLNPCVIIPVYNHEHAITIMVNAVLAYDLPCILVDDGSTPTCAQVLSQLAAAAPERITLLQHTHNLGKGAAVITGLLHAAKLNYTHALQIDADSQHNPADIPKFFKLATSHPDAVITGCPQYDANVPKVRLYARYLTHIWVWINTLSFTIKDSMCGFRVYPLSSFVALTEQNKLGQRMDFDMEVLVRLYWEGVKIINVPTRVRYPIDGVSHFRMLLDNVLISRMHTRLFFGMLWRLPRLLVRKIPQRHWSEINEVSFITGMRFLFQIFRIFGRWPFRVVLYPVLVWYMITQPAARIASKKYLQHVKQLKQTARSKVGGLEVMRHFGTFAESMLDKMLLWNGLFKLDNTQYYVTDHLLNSLKQRRGGLFICAHFGNLDLCRALSKKRSGLKLNMLVHTKHAQLFNKLMAQLDPASALNLIQVTEISPAFAIEMRDKIAQGEFVVIAGDRIPVSSQPRIVFSPFLGENAPFPIGPYVLASLLQCPAYLIFATPTKNGAELHIELFRELITLPRKNREQVLTELATGYAKRLEHYCLNLPLQWFNFYDFWQLAKLDTENAPH